MKQDSVLVIGAGLAGLTAARELQRRSVPVTILEARDRIGGRVRTWRDGFVGDVHAEAGAEFIDEGQDTIQSLARDLGLKLVRVLRTGFGEARRTRGGGVRLHRVVRWERIHRRLKPLVDRFRHADERWDGPVAREIASRSIADFDREPAWLRGLLGADIDDLSLLVLVELAASMEKPPGRQKLYRVAGGCDRLVEKLASPMRDRILTGRRVVAISQTRRSARVKLADGELAAGHVIVTAPASVLRDIAFDPPLPEEQKKAIARLKYGPSTKTHLQFDRPFWRKNRRPRAFATDLPVGAVWDGTEAQVRGSTGLLTLLAGGSTGAAAREKSPDLRWLGFRGARLLASRSVRWELDPWARGAYAYFDPAYDPAWRLLLARPHGRICFAGEHTSLSWQGYMNGAVESGLRAAAEVLSMMGRINGRTGA